MFVGDVLLTPEEEEELKRRQLEELRISAARRQSLSNGQRARGIVIGILLFIMGLICLATGFQSNTCCCWGVGVPFMIIGVVLGVWGITGIKPVK